MFQKKKKKERNGKKATTGGFLSADEKERIFLSDFKHPAVIQAISLERHLNPAGSKRKECHGFLSPLRFVASHLRCKMSLESFGEEALSRCICCLIF